MRLVSFLFILLSFSAVAQEVSFTATVSKNPVQVGEQFKLTFTLSNASGSLGQPNLKDFDRISGPNSSRNMQWINGKMTSSNSYSYVLRAKREGTVTIPAVTANVNNTKLQSKAIVLKVVKGGAKTRSNGGSTTNTQANKQALATNNSEVIASILLDKTSGYLGEQFIATYVIYSRYTNIQFEPIDFPPHNGFWSKEIKLKSQGWEKRHEIINGKQYRVAIIRKEVLYPNQSGKLTIKPYEINCIINRSFFNRGSQIKVKSRPLAVQIKALPGGAPANFNEAVGKYTMKVTLDQSNVKANDAINLKVKISGTGNLLLVEAPEIKFPEDFEVYDPKINDNIAVNGSGISGSREFEYLIIPRHAGEYEIPALTYSYFNPSTSKYKTLSSDPLTFTIAKGDGSEANGGVSYTKKDVKILDQDIRHIRTEEFDLRLKGNYPFLSALHIFGLCLPLLAFFGFLLLRRKTIDAQKDVSGMKSKKANKVARKFLKEAEKLLAAGESSKFYEAIFKALFGYFSDKLNIPMANLTTESIISQLDSSNVPEETIANVKASIQRCEMARFAPVSDISEQEVYNETVQIISNVEDKLK